MTARRISIKMFFARRKTHLPHDGDLGKPCVAAPMTARTSHEVDVTRHVRQTRPLCVESAVTPSWDYRRCPTVITASFPLQFERQLPLAAYTSLLPQRTCFRRYPSQDTFTISRYHLYCLHTSPLQPATPTLALLHAIPPQGPSFVRWDRSTAPQSQRRSLRPSYVTRHPIGIRICAPIERWRP
jgi:hypothetical protein